MKELDYNLSVEEATLALRLVSYVVEHAKKDDADEDGIFIQVSEFIKFIRHEDLPTLVSLVNRYPIHPNLASKIIDWQTEGED